MFIEEDDCHPTTFFAGLPNGIQLSQLSDPWNVREALAPPDAEGWKDAMEK